MRRKRADERQAPPQQPTETVQIPTPTGGGAKSYRVVSVSLYADQAEFVDQTVETLLHSGYAKANRSLVIQTALQHLREDLQKKSPSDIVTYVLEHQGRRPLALARSRKHRAALGAGNRRSDMSSP